MWQGDQEAKVNMCTFFDENIQPIINSIQKCKEQIALCEHLAVKLLKTCSDLSTSLHEQTQLINRYNSDIKSKNEEIEELDVQLSTDFELLNSFLPLIYPVINRHFKLMEFWSKLSPERTTRIKEIILKGEIGYDDFAAIVDNTFGKSSTEWMNELEWVENSEESNWKRKLIALPRYLVLDHVTERDFHDPRQKFHLSIECLVEGNRIFNRIGIDGVGYFASLETIQKNTQITSPTISSPLLTPQIDPEIFQILTDFLEPTDNFQAIHPSSRFPSLRKETSTIKYITAWNIDSLEETNFYAIQ